MEFLQSNWENSEHQKYFWNVILLLCCKNKANWV